MCFHPALLLTDSTPAGYDLTGHVYPLWLAVHELLPQGRIHGWDDGWFGGFPLYYFYFPLPALLTALGTPLLGFLPAVKVVSVLGTVTLPLAIAWLVSEARMERGPAVGATLVGSAFVLMQSYMLLGGNLASTLVGEFSYAIGFALSLCYVAALLRARRATGSRFVLPAVLLAATALSHVVPTMAAVLASLPLLSRSRERRIVLGSWGLGFLLAAFWAVPFLVRLDPPSLYAAAASRLSTAFPLELLPLLPLAALGARWAWVHTRDLLLLAAPGVVGLLVYWLPSGPVHQGRMLPYWFLLVHLLAGVAVGAAVAFAWRHRSPRWLAAAALASLIALAPNATRSSRHLVDWAAFAYSGLEAKSGWSDVSALSAALREQPPGHVYWSDAPSAFATLGSRHLLTLLPFWAPEHGALGGLWRESSHLAPAVLFIDQRILDATLTRDPAAAQAAWTDALGWVRSLRVGYFITTSEPARTGVAAAAGSAPIHEEGRFALFRIDAAPLVSVTGTAGRVALHEVTDRSIDFETTALGIPHLVRIPWFANWKASGATDPIRVEPGFMSVVPTAERVSLQFGSTWAEWLGGILSAAGLVALITLPIQFRRDARLARGGHRHGLHDRGARVAS